MLIVGAKGLAKEFLEIYVQLGQTSDLAFFDDVNEDVGDYLFSRFPILKSEDQIIDLFTKQNNLYTLGLGNPQLRKNLYTKFNRLGGELSSLISPYSRIGSFGNQIGQGSNIMTGTVITTDVTIGIATLINLNCTVGHDSIIGDFVEISPGVKVSGHCSIGSYSTIGTNATILPKVTIGKNVIVGAGAVVTQDIPENSLAVGIPARIIKNLPPLPYSTV